MSSRRPAKAILFSVLAVGLASRLVAAEPETGRGSRTLLERLDRADERLNRLEREQADDPGYSLFRPSSRTRPIEAESSENSEEQAETAFIEQRVSRLEEVWEDLQEDEGYPTLDITGRIHTDAWSFPDDSEGIHFFENPTTGVDPEDRLLIRRIRLTFDGEVFDNAGYRIQLDFNKPAEGEMKDVYFSLTLPYFQTIRVGNQKRPLGLDHLNSSRFNLFIERPLVIEAFNEDARRVGIASYAVSDDERYHWRYGVYTLENAVTDGEVVGDSRQMSVNGRLASSPWYDESSGGRGYFHWAIAGMVARPDGDADPLDTNFNEARFRTRSELRSDSRWLNTGCIAGAEWFEILGVEAIFNLGPFQFVGEYQTNWVQRDASTLGTGPDLFFHGAYAYLAWMLTGEHVPYSRSSGTIGRVVPFEDFFLLERGNGHCARGWGAWQLALRYSYLDLTDEDIAGGVGQNVTFGLVWYLNAYSSLQFNAIYGDIEDHSPVAGFRDGHFTSLGARLRVDF